MAKGKPGHDNWNKPYIYKYGLSHTTLWKNKKF